MKPVTTGDKEHVVKVGEEIDKAKNETPISIIPIEKEPEKLDMPTITQEVGFDFINRMILFNEF